MKNQDIVKLFDGVNTRLDGLDKRMELMDPDVNKVVPTNDQDFDKGIWYKLKCDDTICCYNEPGKHYGFDLHGNWVPNNYWFDKGNVDFPWEEADMEFVYKRLFAKAMEDFPKGSKAVCVDGKEFTVAIENWTGDKGGDWIDGIYYRGGNGDILAMGKNEIISYCLFYKGVWAKPVEKKEKVSPPEDDYALMYAEFMSRYPEDILIKSFAGKDLVVKYNDFSHNVSPSGEAMCFLQDPDHSYLKHCIYRGGVWGNPGPQMIAESELRDEKEDQAKRLREELDAMPDLFQTKEAKEDYIQKKNREEEAAEIFRKKLAAMPDAKSRYLDHELQGFFPECDLKKKWILKKRESIHPDLDKLREEMYNEFWNCKDKHWTDKFWDALTAKTDVPGFDGLFNELRLDKPSWAIKEESDMILDIFYKLCNLHKDVPVKECMKDAIEASELLIKRLEG